VTRAPLIGPALLAAVDDALHLLEEDLAGAKQATDERRAQAAVAAQGRQALARLLAAPPVDLVRWHGELQRLASLLAPLASLPADELTYGSAGATLLVRAAGDELEALAPWAGLLDAAPRAATDGVRPAVHAALAGIPSLAELPDRCMAALADADA